MDTDTLKIKTSAMTVYESILLREIAGDPNDMIPRLMLVWERLEPDQITKDDLTNLQIGDFNKLMKRIVLAIRDTLKKEDARTQSRNTMDQYADALNTFFKGMYDEQKLDEASAKEALGVEDGLCCDNPECPVRKMTVSMIESGEARLNGGELEVRGGELGALQALFRMLGTLDRNKQSQSASEPKLDPELQEKWESLRKNMSKDS